MVQCRNESPWPQKSRLGHQPGHFFRLQSPASHHGLTDRPWPVRQSLSPIRPRIIQVMQNYAYLTVLVIALFGLGSLDWKYKLAWFWKPRLTAMILAWSVMFFLIWDVVLIMAEIVSTNQSWVSGLYIVSPDLPIEEFLFLSLLGYQTLLLWRWQCTRS